MPEDYASRRHAEEEGYGPDGDYAHPFNQDEGALGVGQLLRHTRESYGQDLRHVAESLRIRYVYLQAIEEGRMEDLPGQTYEMGFVRSYAEYLGLDAEAVVSRYKDEVRGLNRRQNLHFPAPVNEGKVPSGAILLVSLLLVGVAYGGWTYLSSQDRSMAEMIPDVPERLRVLIAGEDGAGAAGQDDAWSETLAANQTADSSGGTGLQGGAENGAAATPQLAQAAEDDDAADEAERGSDPTDSANEGEVEESNPVGTFDPELTEEEQREREDAADELQGDTQAPPAAPATQGGQDEDATDENSGAQDEESRLDDAGQAAPQTAELPSGNDALAGIPAAPSTDAARLAAQQAALARQPEPVQVFGATEGPSRIEVRATQDSWVQVRDAEESLLLTRVLRAGEVYRVPDSEGLTMLTGNAGGLRITVDGQTIPTLGPVGAVRRDVALDPESLLGGTSASAPL